jgi:hypothetical protein
VRFRTFPDPQLRPSAPEVRVNTPLRKASVTNIRSITEAHLVLARSVGTGCPRRWS